MGGRKERGRKRWLSGVVAFAFVIVGTIGVASCSGRVVRPDASDPIPVAASERYTEAGPVRAGNRYHISTDGQWTDWYKDSSARGYESTPLLRFFESFRMLPRANWFALGGVIGPSGADVRQLDRLVDQHGFDLSLYANGEKKWSAPATGSLYVFANDVPWAYFNNSGAIFIKLEVVPVD